MPSFDEMFGKSVGTMSTGKGIGDVTVQSQGATQFTRNKAIFDILDWLTVKNLKIKESGNSMFVDTHSVITGLQQASPDIMSPETILYFSCYEANITTKELETAIAFMSNSNLPDTHIWKVFESYINMFIVPYYSFVRSAYAHEGKQNKMIETITLGLSPFVTQFWNAIIHMYQGTLSSYFNMNNPKLHDSVKSLLKQDMEMLNIEFNNNLFPILCEETANALDNFLLSFSDTMIGMHDKHSVSTNSLTVALNNYLFDYLVSSLNNLLTKINDMGGLCNVR